MKLASEEEINSAYGKESHIKFTDKPLNEMIINWMNNQIEDNLFYQTADEPLTFLQKYIPNISFIVAAGGMVRNEREEFLFFKKNGFWDLPKGHVETHETVQEAAIREVKEESGIKQLKIVGALPESWHCYFYQTQPVLKKTYWFEMEANSSEQLQAQISEGISDLKWVSFTQLTDICKGSYKSLNELIQKFYTKLA